MERTQHRSARLHLTTIIVVAAALVFATALIFTTGELLTLWPLYVVPIVIAALSYHLAGAIIVSALSTALLSFMLYAIERDVSALPELIVGMTAFTVSGLVIGWQAQRSMRHSQALEEMSITDPLTGLFKREHLELRLAEELRRGERYGSLTSFILVSVDCFDEFKEQFGRYKADVMLEHLGEVILLNIRDTDIVGRYDETSFGVVLPCAPAEGARSCAQRIAAVVRETEFEGDVLEPSTRCTVRVGVATYPDDVSTMSALMCTAEQRVEGGAR